ncbi:MAG: biotin/lipoate A/B protein ligase family protein [Chloroflexota bacterium]
MRQWRLIYDTPMMGSYNMAIDDAIMGAVASGNSLPTLRLYAWQPLCLSLGYGQRVRDVDMPALKTQGWGLVRRPTGGKAILHGDELTYSVAIPKDHPLAEGDVVESYRRISEALMIALTHLGLTPASEKQAKGNSGLGPVCFEVPSHYEITSNGKKLIGSAQVRRRDGILQHGTLPLHGDLTRICDVLAYENEYARQQAKTVLLERATTLESVLDELVSWQTAADAIVCGFEEAFDIDFTEEKLSENESVSAQTLLTERYANAAWTHKR